MGFNVGQGFGGGGGGGGFIVADEILPVFYSAEVNFLITGQATCILPYNVPTGFNLWLDEIGVICTLLAGAIVAKPTISFGLTGNDAAYKAASLMSLLTAVNTRDLENVFLVDTPMTSSVVPTFNVTIAASGPTVYKGLVYYSGVLIPQ